MWNIAERSSMIKAVPFFMSNALFIIMSSQMHNNAVSVELLLFAFQSMFISVWVSRLEIVEFPDDVCRSVP